jgi:hypothetical protein
MRSIWQRLQSRKFLLTLAAAILLATAALAHKMTWDDAITKFVYLALGYLGVEGAIDILAIPKKGR